MNKLNFKYVYALIITILAGIFCYTWLESRITLSVVIPVYNAEQDLARCLNSVFKQEGNFEVIAVNDGSTDSSLAILEDYKKKYSNLKVINQENQGVSAARNKGLANAKNKYVTFVDSDDWLEPDMFKKVLEKIKKDKPDILQTGHYDVYDRKWVADIQGEEVAKKVREETKYPMRSFDLLSLFSPFYANKAYSDLFYADIAVHGHFFKKEFLKKYAILFPENIKLAEDYVFMFRAFLHNPYISILKDPVYNYHNRINSLSKSQKMLQESRKTFEFMKKTPEYQKASHRQKLLINDSWLSLTLLGISNMQRYNNLTIESLEEVYKIYKTFSVYNSEELKGCRNYQNLKSYLESIKFNRSL